MSAIPISYRHEIITYTASSFVQPFRRPKTFLCLWQFVLAEKALFHRELDVYKRIISLPKKDLYKIYYHISTINNSKSEEWDRIVDNVVKHALRIIITHDEFPKTILLCTEGYVLGECGKDLEWCTGIGSKGYYSRYPEKWTGKNRLGKLVMEVRDEFITEINKKEAQLFKEQQEQKKLTIQRNLYRKKIKEHRSRVKKRRN